MGRLSCGDDLHDALTRFCQKNHISLGQVEAIGAVQKACFKFYDQEKRDYESIALDQPLEILRLAGNVSLMNGEPMVHAHIILADSEGRAYGGHVAPGTIVFACEYIIQAFERIDFERVEDVETGLSLWKL